MWDRPGELNALASVLFALSGVALVYGAVLYVVRLPIFPLREVVVSDAPGHVTYAQAAAIVKADVKGNFFTVNLTAVRSAFEALAWVRSANVRREWPDRLEVTLEEHVPLARWGGHGLVDMQGDVFQAAYDGKLPMFIGPADGAKEMAIQYTFFRDTLAAIHGVPSEVKLTPRGAWELHLADGMTIELGREHIEERLLRFVGSYDAAVARLPVRFDYVDLRYANGFAVRVPGLGAKSGEQGAERGKNTQQDGMRRAGAGKNT